MEFPPKDSFPPPILSNSRKKKPVFQLETKKRMILFRDKFPLEGELTTDSVCGKNNTSYGNPTPV